MEIHWKTIAFEQFLPQELYAMLRLRSEVFVLEQQCFFQDLDNLDQQALHLSGWRSGELIAYARFFDKGIVSENPSIGRVVVPRGERHTGIGRLLMDKAIHSVFELYGKQPLNIWAQCYLQKFYASFGFIEEGLPYMEDGILHVKMVLP
jgi:ElaA protein